MPNDMSHTRSALPDALSAMALRTDRFVARARALISDPALTTGQAAAALDHLEALQASLAAARQEAAREAVQALRRVEGRFRPHENRLAETRAEVTSALLRARPSGAEAYGIVPHGGTGGAAQAGATGQGGVRGAGHRDGHGHGGGGGRGDGQGQEQDQCRGEGDPAAGAVAAGPGGAPRDAGSGEGSLRPVSACRALLDLEALRPYLDAEALRAAIAARLRAEGRGDVAGVTYALLPGSAHLPLVIS